MPISRTMIAIAAASVSVSMVPAFAATSTVHEQSKEVQIFGYDLTDAADAETVLAKIQATAKNVCTIRSNLDTARERAERQECAENATTVAVNSLRSPTLTALWQEELNQ